MKAIFEVHPISDCRCTATIITDVEEGDREFKDMDKLYAVKFDCGIKEFVCIHHGLHVKLHKCSNSMCNMGVTLLSEVLYDVFEFIDRKVDSELQQRENNLIKKTTTLLNSNSKNKIK